jgi:hypothetical protein
MPELKIAKSGPTLPLDAVTRTFGIYGQRGTGKTNTATVMVEQMVRAKAHVVVIDPKGDWWGITRRGEGPGLSGIVLGGDYADVPLEETGGALVSEIVTDRLKRVVVLDISGFRKAARRRFLADFLEGLYDRNREALHVVFEEAHQVLPHIGRSTGGKSDIVLNRVIGAAEDIVTLGRKRGLGISLVSQRFATVNATVREQVETLLLHRLSGPLDRKAAKGWIETNGDAELTARILNELASHDLGEAVLYSPGWLGGPTKLRIKTRQTFDSSATPEVGAEAVEPTARAPVDLDELRTRMADTVERAKANDPKELRKETASLRQEIARLERQLEQRPAETETVEVKVPYVPEEVRAAIAHLAAHTRDLGGQLRIAADDLDRTASRADDSLDEDLPDKMPESRPRKPTLAAPASGRRGSAPPPPARLPRVSTSTSTNVSTNGHGGDESLTGPQQRVLDALAWLAAIGFDQPTKGQVGFIAGYRVGKKVGGTYGNILGQLNGAGLLAYPSPGTAALTDAGRAVAQAPNIEPTTEGLQAAVFARLSGPEQRVLQGIIDAYPDPIAKQHAGELAGYTVGEKIGGTFGNILGKLRSLGLVDYPGPGLVVAESILFLEGSYA